jgi:cell fate regulator YaaT (PSP1 superfamily)
VYRSVIVHFEDDSLVNAVSPPDLAVHRGDFCVVECSRMSEFGQILQVADHDGPIPPRGTTSTILRRATLQDQAKAKENSVLGKMAAKTVHKRVEELKVPIHIVQVRYSFDRAVLHVTFTSEERVDYLELVKTLAGELRTRIEIKSLGIRDAARLAGGLAVCGRPLCCRVWLKEFEVVSVKMAKTQRLTLNPGTISGMCGRLKCCLKYEFAHYKHASEHLPKDGAPVCCPDGCGRVWDKDVLEQRVKVRLDDGRVLEYPVEALKPVQEAGAQAESKEEQV